jgi:hypothetical protein
MRVRRFFPRASRHFEPPASRHHVEGVGHEVEQHLAQLSPGPQQIIGRASKAKWNSTPRRMALSRRTKANPQ